MWFLKLLLFLFLAAVVMAVVVAWSFVRQVRNAAHRFQQQPDAPNQTKVNGNVIIDHRTPDEANKKIISDDEGEYVDFEE